MASWRQGPSSVGHCPVLQPLGNPFKFVPIFVFPSKYILPSSSLCHCDPVHSFVHLHHHRSPRHCSLQLRPPPPPRPAGPMLPWWHAPIASRLAISRHLDSCSHQPTAHVQALLRTSRQPAHGRMLCRQPTLQAATLSRPICILPEMIFICHPEAPPLPLDHRHILIR